MNDEHHLQYIQFTIDKVFSDARQLEMHYRPIDFGYQMHLYCRGFLVACLNFNIISLDKFNEFDAYCISNEKGL